MRNWIKYVVPNKCLLDSIYSQASRILGSSQWSAHSRKEDRICSCLYLIIIIYMILFISSYISLLFQTGAGNNSCWRLIRLLSTAWKEFSLVSAFSSFSKYLIVLSSCWVDSSPFICSRKEFLRCDSNVVTIQYFREKLLPSLKILLSLAYHLYLRKMTYTFPWPIEFFRHIFCLTNLRTSLFSPLYAS